MENDGNAAAAPRAALVFKKERREVATDFGEEWVDFMAKESHPQPSLNRKKSNANHPHAAARRKIILPVSTSSREQQEQRPICKSQTKAWNLPTLEERACEPVDMETTM
tara:strand:+ start:910 stop:1236 length:327 start_codon:yes stop_codon:yes gene_type:complete